MAAVVGFKTVRGFVFNTTVTEDDVELLNGPLRVYNSIRIYEGKRKENHFQLLSEDALGEVTLKGYPVCPELDKLYQEVNGKSTLSFSLTFVVYVLFAHPSSATFFYSCINFILFMSCAGTIEEVRPALSSSTALSEGIPNEEAVAYEDDVKKNWSHIEVKALIHLYEENKASFENHIMRRKDVWKKIAKKLNKEGDTTFSVDQVDRKWRNLKDRYKRIVDVNKRTGRWRSSWLYFDLMDRILQKDLSIYPPCIIQAGCSYTVETAGAVTLTADSLEQTVSPLVSSTSPPTTTSASSEKRSRSNDDDSPQCVIRYIEGFALEGSAQNKRVTKLLKKIYKEKKRRNDLFERFLNMRSSSTNND
uniref:MADF domain-containing protein n=1 Tax=Eptatretus burgeri TaxID=7764 RepID=A0A8C4WX33_EPTBU